ncbi:MAG: hypothetical protein OJF49_003005 [Ktedonobacterales bacterium]|jgi:LysM repeat protein|nr:MAG: hypothetical protein OJF49_003005 [Ktedonobacterales bacterium]
MLTEERLKRNWEDWHRATAVADDEEEYEGKYEGKYERRAWNVRDDGRGYHGYEEYNGYNQYNEYGDYHESHRDDEAYPEFPMWHVREEFCANVDGNTEAYGERYDDETMYATHTGFYAPARTYTYDDEAETRASTGAVARLRQHSMRLAQLGAYRPMVRIPGRAKEDAKGSARKTKLPPIWLLGNLFILLIAAVAILPHVTAADAAPACKWHTVVPGDTLGDIGWANHTTAMALASANHIANPDLILVGQKLCIPLKHGATNQGATQPKAATLPETFGPVKGVQPFIKFALPYAQSAHQQTGWPTSLILAQWGVEHGWKLPDYTGYNFGNCGAVPGEPRVGGLNVPGSPAAFTYSKTPKDGLRVYVHVAHLAYYRNVTAAAHQGVDAAARALGQSPWDAGHYTNHGSPGSTLLSVLKAYNLYQYDK